MIIYIKKNEGKRHLKETRENINSNPLYDK